MTRFRTVVFFFCCLAALTYGHGFAASAEDEGAVTWQMLEPGLELGRALVTPVPALAGETVPAVQVTFLRIDPARYAFSLHMASEKGNKSLTELGRSENLTAAINAGMYLPDRLTSTGYLRSGTHTNNAHIANSFNAFFVAEPMSRPKSSLPFAQLLDKTRHDWDTALTSYDLVMQNYRMNTLEGRVIWKQAERLHSIAALSQDASQRVYFILCPTPVQAADFVAALLRLPLELGTIMYLEGGSEAALLIRAGGQETVEAGRHPSGLWSGDGGLMLPNVLGVRPRASQ